MQFQTDWRWCRKCQGLHFGADGSGVCPAGGTHSSQGSGNYALSSGDPHAAGQANWKWCFKCQGLYFAGDKHNLGHCPAGGGHDDTRSGMYRLRSNPAPGQSGWRWCNKCMMLHFVGGNSAGICPSGGGHSSNGSGDYALLDVRDRFRFSLDSFRIKNTRSRHEDTVFVSAALAVGRKAPISATRSMGDLNNGDYPVGIALDATIGDTEGAVFSYAIVNNGHTPPGKVESELQNLVSELADKGAQAAAAAAGAAIGAAVGASIGTAIIPILGTALGALSGWLVSSAAGLIFADCDGPVAAGLNPFVGSDLKGVVASDGPIRETVDHPGTDSPAGCGSNSEYTTTWSVTSI